MATVVIVDDEKDLVEVLSDIFELKNIEVLGIGENGQQAVDLCMKHSPDYLILDLAMPQYDGFYALDKLKERKNPTKIIIMSGTVDLNNESKMKKYQTFALLTKPVDPNELVEIIINSGQNH